MITPASTPIRRTLLLSIFLLTPMCLFGQEIAGSWATFSANGFTPRGAFTSQEVGGKIYVIGGFTGSDYITTIQVYDPATDSWDSITNATGTFTPRRGMSSVVVGGKIYTFGGANGSGGSNGSGALNNVEVFDPATNVWDTLPKMPTARWRSCAVLLGGKIYVMGGYVSGPVNTVEIFDTLTNTWSQGDTASFGARSDFAAEVINGKIYVVGGQGDTVSPQVYDTESNAWTTPVTSGSYVERQGLCAAVINGEIYAFGGTDGEYLNTFDVFNPADNSWTTPLTSNVPVPRAGGCGTLYNGKVYIMGGRDDWGQLDTNSVFIPAVSGVIQTVSSTGISLFPNPTDGVLTIQTMPSVKASHLTVMNILGQILIDKMIEPGSLNITLDLSGYSSGIYEIRISGDNAMFEEKIIKR
jgi:N-acetylneuraminic acid mutarotase